jgi:hypothetical protein
MPHTSDLPDSFDDEPVDERTIVMDHARWEQALQAVRTACNLIHVWQRLYTKEPPESPRESEVLALYHEVNLLSALFREVSRASLLLAQPRARPRPRRLRLQGPIVDELQALARDFGMSPRAVLRNLMADVRGKLPPEEGQP